MRADPHACASINAQYQHAMGDMWRLNGAGKAASRLGDLADADGVVEVVDPYPSSAPHVAARWVSREDDGRGV
ncbi:hypothetical protein DS837_31180 [Azospirillum brasilense]|uniref:Uncharacterized protein n=1 Tax=Azospirillum brasilense TaxID=192 RepID=A0A6L3ARC5_AZOBR|nr:hypothetical protein DS837_31180 [Azospirillum brasilense]